MSAIETMSTTWLWIHIIVLAIATYALRSSFIGIFSYYEIPDQFEDDLKLIPPAVLAALTMPSLVYREGAYHLSLTDPFLLAGLVAGIVAWKTESFIGTLTIGISTYFGAIFMLNMY
jgi:branched-subunit amino acid transport protein